MHENRETSEAPAAKPGGRSAGEGKSHTAGVYACEESHSGVVPMNHSNKDGHSWAESGEGRPLIKENASQPNTHPTRSGEHVSQGLAGVRKAAREHKEMRFTALLHHLQQRTGASEHRPKHPVWGLESHWRYVVLLQLPNRGIIAWLRGRSPWFTPCSRLSLEPCLFA